MKRLILFYFLFLLVPSANAIDVYEDISNALRSGDSRQIALFFGPSIDLTIANREDVYSKAQAEMILRDFFAKNPPKSFTIHHNGSSKEGTLYAIGSLVTITGKSFRTSFFLKVNGGKSILQELRIESE